VQKSEQNCGEHGRFVTPADFVRIYKGWSYKQVLKLVKTKGFPSFKPVESSNRYLIDIAEIPKWIEIQKKKPKPLK